MSEAWINRYCTFFETLSAETLGQIETLLDPQAVFQDPFNHVQGRDAIRRIFAHLLETCPGTEFRVVESCPLGQAAYIRWRFLPDRQKDLVIEGVSRVVFSENGQVLQHVDYWDSSSQLFAQLKVIGPPIRWLLRRAQASRHDQLA